MTGNQAVLLAEEDRKQELLRRSSAVIRELQELDVNELDQAEGGYWWAADDSPIDGHELFCMLAWHDIDWSKEHDDWCTSNYIFKDMYYKN